MSQANYIDKLLFDYQIDTSTPNPIYSDLLDGKNDNTPHDDKHGYISLVMKLLFIATHTRPDVLFIVSYLTSKNTAPNQRDYQQALRLLKYLKHTRHFNLTYKQSKDSDMIIAFSDASNGIYPDAKCQSGCLIYMNDQSSPINYRSIKQKCQARGSTEAELVALDECVLRITRIYNILKELNTNPKINVYCDNKSTIELAKHGITKSNSYAKFFIAKTNLVSQNLRDYNMNLEYIQSEDNKADVLTKVINNKSYQHIGRQLLNLDPSTTSLGGDVVHNR